MPQFFTDDKNILLAPLGGKGKAKAKGTPLAAAEEEEEEEVPKDVLIPQVWALRFLPVIFHTHHLAKEVHFQLLGRS